MSWTCKSDVKVCDSASIRNLSDYCVRAWSDGNFSTPGSDSCCYWLGDEVSLIGSVWCVVNAILGSSCNLLTLLAIPAARKRNKFGFGESCDCTTLFILNLAFSDLVYCSINMPIYSLMYWRQAWIFGHDLCFIFAAFRYVNVFADWMSLALIAISRCLGLTWSKWAEQHFTSSWGMFLIFFTWSYSCAIVSLALFNVVGDFGYDCRSGKCGLIEQRKGDIVDPHLFYFSIGFFIPCIFILLSYLTIWGYVRHADTKLIEANSGDMISHQLHHREVRMTCTLLIISLCYLICDGSVTLWNMIDPHWSYPNMHLAVYCVYWLQYSLNFLIYCLRSEQFRMAYADYLKTIWKKFRNCCCSAGDFSVRQRLSSKFISSSLTKRSAKNFPRIKKRDPGPLI